MIIHFDKLSFHRHMSIYFKNHFLRAENRYLYHYFSLYYRQYEKVSSNIIRRLNDENRSYDFLTIARS